MKKSNKVKMPLVFRIGLVLICASMITSHMMGGIFARYSTTATGSASAQVAKIDCAVNYEFSGYGDLGDIDGDGELVYVVMEEFSVENTGDVTFKYEMNLKFSKDVSSATYDSPVAITGITLTAPKNVNVSDTVTYVYHPSEDSTSGATALKTPYELIGRDTFVEGKVYYASSENGAEYTWTETTLKDGALSVSLDSLMIGQQYYYKIIYFIKPEPGVNLTQQQTTLLYSIKCEQID